MRTTVTLDPDVEALIKRDMDERGLTFKQALNEAVRGGAGPHDDEARPRWSTHDMGEPLIDLTKANQLAGQLEDQEIIRKMARGA